LRLRNDESPRPSLIGTRNGLHLEVINETGAPIAGAAKDKTMTLSIAENTTTTSSTSWTLDPTHSSATFKIRHMMVSNVRGEFQKLSGSVVYDKKRPEAAKVQVEIDVASINTREEKRDEHLRSADFFDAANFPKITFVSKSVALKDAGDLEVTGDLTIRGVTRPVVLAVEGPTGEHVDPYGNVRIGASASTTIKRSDFGITWNGAIEAGGVLVGDEVKIQLDVSLIKGKSA
jgi:polyisoprenoid-binding protein YceI